ncbi:hypothetical protein [Geodermatophilus sp. SYSU D00815]
MDGSTAQQRFVRALMGVVAASALVYPMLLCAVQLVFAQLLVVDVMATVLWLSVAVVCSVGLVAALRWGAARRIRSYWLLLGLAPPAAYELWLVWPAITG